MHIDNKELKVLDCTLRDGGYYNNWHFSLSLINKYLKSLSISNINYVEIGFRSLVRDKNIGLTGYSNDKFLNKLSIPKNINLGIMINSSELISKNLNKKITIKNFFTKNSKTKIKFVRLATHIEDIFKIKDAIKWLKKNNYLVSVNIMQISEIKLKDIKKYCKFLKNNNVDIIYLADSLGCLKPSDIYKIYKIFNKNWNRDLGIHAHDNLGLALSNSMAAVKSGANWIDGTIQGMGRGPGNVKTEKLVEKLINNKNYIHNTFNVNKSLITRFKILKKKI